MMLLRFTCSRETTAWLQEHCPPAVARRRLSMACGCSVGQRVRGQRMSVQHGHSACTRCVRAAKRTTHTDKRAARRQRRTHRLHHVASQTRHRLSHTACSNRLRRVLPSRQHTPPVRYTPLLYSIRLRTPINLVSKKGRIKVALGCATACVRPQQALRSSGRPQARVAPPAPAQQTPCTVHAMTC